MPDRVVLGKANDGSSDIYGLWVSKPAILNVFDGNVINDGVLCDSEDMLFDSRHDYGQVLAKGKVEGDGGADNISVTVRDGVDPFIICKNYESSGTEISTKGQGDGTAQGFYFNEGAQYTISISVTNNSGTVTITPDDDAEKDIAYIIIQ